MSAVRGRFAPMKRRELEDYLAGAFTRIRRRVNRKFPPDLHWLYEQKLEGEHADLIRARARCAQARSGAAQERPE